MKNQELWIFHNFFFVSSFIRLYKEKDGKRLQSKWREKNER